MFIFTQKNSLFVLEFLNRCITCLGIDLGQETDNDTVVGVFVGSGQELAEFFIAQVLMGIRSPLENAKLLLEILFFPHARLTDKIRDVLDLFVFKAADGADDYFEFWRGIASITWSFFVRLYNLLPVPEINFTDSIKNKLDGFADTFKFDGIAEKFDDFYKFNKKKLLR